MTRTALVTGGAGFIGCAISEGLAERFDRIVVVDNLHPQVHKERVRPAALAKKIELVVGDVTDRSVWDSVLADFAPDVVIHLAAETGTGQSLTESTRHGHVNVVGTTVMLDALSHSGKLPKKIVLTSSRAVYGEGPWGAPGSAETVYPGQRSNEQLAASQWDFPGLAPKPMDGRVTRPSPVSVYAATKLAQEHILTSWAIPYGVKSTVLRLQNVYGPGQSLSNPYTGIVSLFCRLAREGKSIPIYEDGLMLRDFVLIDDVASAILAAVDCEAPTPLPMDVGIGVASTIAEVAAKIARNYGAPAPHVCAKYRFGDVRHASCTIEGTVAVLDWKPVNDVDAGLSKLQAWIETQLEPVRQDA